jgi:hypothetical protein
LVDGAELDSLLNKIGEPVRAVRQKEGKKIGGRGGAGAHWRRRISPEMLAKTAVSDEVIPPIGGVSGKREKEGRGRRLWAIYTRDGVGSGLGFGARGRSDGAGGVGLL